MRMGIPARTEIDRSTLPGVLNEFASYKSGIEMRSPLTVEEYLLDLRTFLRFEKIYKSGKRPDDVDFDTVDIRDLDLNFVASIRAEDIYEFLYFVGAMRQNSATTKARKLSAIKAFYKFWFSKRKMLSQNPTADIDTPKKKATLPKYLTVEECASLLDAIRNDAQSKTVTRDYAIATLFLNCGMRLSELCGINLRDIDPQLRSLRVLGKGAKERMIYLNAACRDALTAYLDDRHRYLDSGASVNPALFLSSRGQRISNKTVQWMIGKYLKAAGLESRSFSVHKLRHTAATLLYQTGKVDVRVLKDILGHEQLTTTQIYTHISDAQMERAMEENPLSKVQKKKD